MEWKLVDNRLVGSKKFKSMTEVASFLLEIAKYSDQMDHHPDVSIKACSCLELQLYSHTSGKVSDRDYSWLSGLGYSI